MRKLSESDLEALRHAFAEYGDLDFRTKTDLSHEHPAFRNAEAAGRQRMDYGDFLEGDMASPEIIADLEETAHRLCI
jgi:hypothetical protein